LYLLYSVHTGSGAHPASYRVDTGGRSFSRVKRPGREADQSPTSNAEVKNGGIIRLRVIMLNKAQGQLYLYHYIARRLLAECVQKMAIINQRTLEKGGTAIALMIAEQKIMTGLKSAERQDDCLWPHREKVGTCLCCTCGTRCTFVFDLLLLPLLTKCEEHR
jgi:hypothetical protein